MKYTWNIVQIVILQQYVHPFEVIILENVTIYEAESLNSDSILTEVTFEVCGEIYSRSSFGLVAPSWLNKPKTYKSFMLCTLIVMYMWLTVYAEYFLKLWRQIELTVSDVSFCP